MKRGELVRVALASPDDTPPGNEIGYWSNGSDRAISVTSSVSGRRLFVEFLPGEELRTNVLDVFFDAASSF